MSEWDGWYVDDETGRLTPEDSQELAMVLPGLMLIRDSMANAHRVSGHVDEASATMLAQITRACVIVGKLIS
jgi:hypothetical protein